MAKRKRLTPANPAFLADPAALPAETAPKRAPIADVASDASAQSALQELSGVLSNARDKGLMIEELPLDSIDMRHLVRDRLKADQEELDALMASLRSRGQQTPIEVVRLSNTPTGKKTGQYVSHKYGLVSGWRRMLALRTLAETEPDLGLQTVLARVIQPESAQQAYVAMVEENEIRVNLSHYERARIAVKAIEEGVYETQKQALNGLFGNVARAKRSKIGSFMRIVEALDDMLYHPAHISEKLGLALVREMNRSEAFTAGLRQDLLLTDRSVPEVEMEVLVQSVKIAQDLQEGPVHILEPWELRAQEEAEAKAAQAAASPAPSAPSSPSIEKSAPTTQGAPKIHEKIHAGLSLQYTPEKGRIELVGKAVDDDLQAALKDWLQQRAAD